MINKNDKSIDLIATLYNCMVSRIKEGSNHQLDYELVCEHLARTRLEKCNSYGESRYEEDDNEFNLWMSFSDVHRKYIRLRQLTSLAVSGDKKAIDDLKDTYLDLANYGIMGFQILNKEAFKND